jgi:hypothetical protein
LLFVFNAKGTALNRVNHFDGGLYGSSDSTTQTTLDSSANVSNLVAWHPLTAPDQSFRLDVLFDACGGKNTRLLLSKRRSMADFHPRRGWQGRGKCSKAGEVPREQRGRRAFSVDVHVIRVIGVRQLSTSKVVGNGTQFFVVKDPFPNDDRMEIILLEEQHMLVVPGNDTGLFSRHGTIPETGVRMVRQLNSKPRMFDSATN